MKELIPCPWCKSPGVVRIGHPGFKYRYLPQCTGCGVRFTEHYLTEAEAAAAWDARASGWGPVSECVRVVNAYAEEIKHTSHMDGLGMGDQRSEQVCLEIAKRIAALDSEPPEGK